MIPQYNRTHYNVLTLFNEYFFDKWSNIYVWYLDEIKNVIFSQKLGFFCCFYFLNKL